MSELKMAYCTAVNDTLVKLDKNATNAALANPAAKLSALTTAYIIATYPGVQSIGGARADPLPDHPSGRAIDIMTGSDVSLGDAINADVQSQAGRFGVTYTMWRVSAHFDHIHVTVS